MKKIKWVVIAVMPFVIGLFYLWYGSFIAGGLFVLTGVLNLNVYITKTFRVNSNQEINNFEVVSNNKMLLDLIKENKKIEAIKQVRKLTNCSLFDAEKYVESQLIN